jgi:hypothetical protein
MSKIYSPSGVSLNPEKQSACGASSSELFTHGDTFYIDEVFVKINGKQGTAK